MTAVLLAILGAFALLWWVWGVILPTYRAKRPAGLFWPTCAILVIILVIESDAIVLWAVTILPALIGPLVLFFLAAPHSTPIAALLGAAIGVAALIVWRKPTGAGVALAMICSVALALAGGEILSRVVISSALSKAQPACAKRVFFLASVRQHLNDFKHLRHAQMIKDGVHYHWSYRTMQFEPTEQIWYDPAAPDACAHL